MNIKRLLLACLAYFVLSGSAVAEPALWAIRDGKSTIYLFGTFHLLRTGTDWNTPKIAKAYRLSSEVWLELLDDDQATMQPLVAQLGMDAAHPLSRRLPVEEVARIDKRAQLLGLPGEKALDGMRPWLASLSLVASAYMQAGFNPDQGADHVIKGWAQHDHKTLQAFETASQQLHFFADLPPAQELSILEETLDELNQGPAKFLAMADAWSKGDVPAITKEFAEFEQPQYKLLYKTLIVNRNQAWATKLAERLKTGTGTSFVAVGAGHLAGPDSLIVALGQRGIKVERE
jgi:uncharacterized protein YbaP (TraB family)